MDLGPSMKPRHVKKRAKAQAKRHDVIESVRTLRDGLNIPLRDALAQVETWLRNWGRIT